MTTTDSLPAVWPSVPPAEPPAAPAAVQDTPAAQACADSLSGTAATTCQAYTAYSRYLTMGGSALYVAATVAYTALEKAGQSTGATDVWAGCGAVYTVLQGMDDAFLQAIEDLNTGKPFSPVDPPSNLPDFPDAPSGGKAATTVIDNVWTLVAGAIQLVASRLTDGPLKVALDGSLEKGQAAFERLVPVLEQYFGSSTD